MNEFLLFYVSQPRFKVPFELSPHQIQKKVNSVSWQSACASHHKYAIT